jgi:hypothetical protein
LVFKSTIPESEYGAGEVKIQDAGTYEWLLWGSDRIEVILHGTDFSGKYVLLRFKKAGDKEWIVLKAKVWVNFWREKYTAGKNPFLADCNFLHFSHYRIISKIPIDVSRTISVARIHPARMIAPARALLHLNSHAIITHPYSPTPGTQIKGIRVKIPYFFNISDFWVIASIFLRCLRSHSDRSANRSQVPNSIKMMESPNEHMMSINGKGLIPSPRPTTTASGWRISIDATIPSISARATW